MLFEAGVGAARCAVRTLTGRRRLEQLHLGQVAGMFFFFSNRVGCLPSLLISLVLTGILLLATGVFR